ncbi:MAG: tetratricopeptide repeat protein [Pseudomonadota bacterium]
MDRVARWTGPDGVQRQARRKEANRLVQEANWAELRAFATTWSEDEPSDFIAWGHLGLAEQRLGHHEPSIAAYRASLELNPAQAFMWSNLGYAYFSRKDMESAIDALKRALALQPDNAMALRNLGATYHYLGKHAEMIEAYEELQRINPAAAETFRKQFLVAAPSAPIGPASPAPASPATVKPTTATPPAADRSFGFTISNSPAPPLVYHWHGGHYQEADAFLAAVTAQVADAVANVKPSSAPWGSLRVVLPKRRPPSVRSLINPAAATEAPVIWAHADRIIDDGRVTALQRSGLFDPVTAETGALAIPEAGSSDFALWFANGNWNLRYHDGDPETFAEDRDLTTWLATLVRRTQTALDGGGTPTLRLSIRYPTAAEGALSFQFNGADHFSVETLVQAMNAAFLDQAQQIQPMARRLGGRIRLLWRPTNRRCRASS